MIQPKDRRNKTIELKYLNDIAQLVDLPIEKVKEVFSYYILYLLHDIAIADSPKGTLNINLPCFCSLLLKPNNHPHAKTKLQIEIRQETKNHHLREILENAYFEDKDYLLEQLIEKFSKDMKTDIEQKLENDRNNA
jgi:hypothetical protein